MSDFELIDLEDDIPVNQILRRNKGNRSNSINFNDDDISSPDEYISEEENESMVYFTEKEIQEVSVLNVKDDIEVLNHEEEIPETYHCSSCDIHFSELNTHLARYHKHESVVIESAEIKTDNEENPEVILPEAIEPIDTKDQIIKEETCLDSYGRPYVRKEVLLKDYKKLQSASKNTSNNQKSVNWDEKIQGNSINKNKQKKDKHKCVICHKILYSFKDLAMHMLTHNVEIDQISEIKEENSQLQTYCDRCNTTFPSKKSLKLHARMHDPIKSKLLDSEDLTNGKTSNNEQFYCEICEKSYDKSFEEIHDKSHKNGLKHLCNLCNRRFTSGVNLMMHQKAHKELVLVQTPKADVSTSKHSYPCSYCGRLFARPHEKVKHEWIHTGLKPYKCEICGKGFRVSYCLTLHLRTHTGLRPYVCSFCNKRFKAYSVYNHHLMTHSDVRAYKCPYCPKTFKTAVQLGGHKNSHTKPFSCPECNRPFASLYAVKAHMEVHKKRGQNLRHRCPVCGAVYARLFSLRDHLKEKHELEVDTDLHIDKSVETAQAAKIKEPEKSEAEKDDEITISEIEHFQTEEVVAEWLNK